MREQGSVLYENNNYSYDVERCNDTLEPTLLRSILERANDSDRFEERERHVSGNSINDIPSTYVTPPLRRHEKSVIGTYVDLGIVPGYRYKVRLNGTNEFLFNDESKYLESIGQGYGKRLTFESNDVLNNGNFFWSDSSAAGYAFSICVLQTNDEFRVFQNDEEIGSAYVESVSDDQEILRSENDITQKEHIKDIHVNFTCRFNLNNLQESFSSEVSGMVKVTKGKYENRAVTKHIMALLLPSGKVLVLKPTAKIL